MSRKADLEIRVSERFIKSYKKAFFCLKELAEGAVQYFVLRQRSDPKTVLHKYDRLIHLLPEAVIEIEISGGKRLLAHFNENRLLLLDMGDHEVGKRYDISKLYFDLFNNEPAPPQFWPESKSRFFVRYPDKTPMLKYETEVTSEWLYSLEDDQQTVVDNIENAILFSQQHQPHFIIGGPGTGKTCIILNLLKDFVDSDYKVGIVISDNLKAYIEKSTHADISRYCVDLYIHPPLGLLLIDDPVNIRKVLQTSDNNQVDTIVVAFDPLQLHDDIIASDLDELSSGINLYLHMLSTCYRQKENVGKTTKHVVDIVADSTPFLNQDKIDAFRQDRQTLTELSNNLIFVNPHGYSEYYPVATVNDIKAEVNRILKDEWLMWTHWPGLLILLDGCNLTDDANAAIEPLMQREYVKILSFDQIEEIKGLEFQHVFIFIKKEEFEEIQNGFTGSGQKNYRRRRLYRIPFSRAKDSVVTFAIDIDQ
jgi:GTPase SAR1 family protein